jgi:hypothetical protein
MSEEQRRILDMLAAGKINAAEAERLLEAVGSKSDGTSGPAGAKPKYLVINVDSTGENGHHAGKVHIRVPLQVLRAGVKLASLMPASAKAKINEKLQEKGIAYNVDSLRPEDIEELVDALGEFFIDVNDRQDKVHIYCE